jgi:hypothetical protein
MSNNQEEPKKEMPQKRTAPHIRPDTDGESSTLTPGRKPQKNHDDLYSSSSDEDVTLVPIFKRRQMKRYSAKAVTLPRVREARNFLK